MQNAGRRPPSRAVTSRRGLLVAAIARTKKARQFGFNHERLQVPSLEVAWYCDTHLQLQPMHCVSAGLSLDSDPGNDMTDDSPKSTVFSLARGLSVLDVVAAANAPIGITDISRELNLAKGSVSRLVATLVQAGYLTRNQATRKYELGIRLWELGSRAISRIEIHGVARPVLEDIHERTGETVHLSVLSSEGAMVFLDMLEATRSIRPTFKLGDHTPAHCVANGKALLACMSPRQRDDLLTDRLRLYTDTTIKTKAQLLEALEEVRQAGYAINRGEYRPDVSGVAAAVCDRTNFAVGAIGISLPTISASDEKMEELGALVAEGAQKVSRALGASNTACNEEVR